MVSTNRTNLHKGYGLEQDEEEINAEKDEVRQRITRRVRQNEHNEQNVYTSADVILSLGLGR